MKENNDFTMTLFGSLMANIFNPMQDNSLLPPMLKIDTEEYSQVSEEERSLILERAINNDPFWGKFFKKIKNKDSYESLIEVTRDIDTQIAELNKKRWDIVKEWTIGEEQ